MLGVAPLVAGGLLTACSTSSVPGIEWFTSGGVLADLQPDGRFDRFLAEQAAKGQFSGTVLLAHRGQPVLTRSHGLADRQRSIPNQTDTVFALGSMIKMFTGVAVAQLAQQGKLAFHKTLGGYLGGFPAEIADTVTVHQLLTHTSGIGRPPIMRQEEQPEQPPQTTDTLETAMAADLDIIRRMPLQFPAGSKSAYSNDGFLVLSAIVAQVSGQSYYDYVREHIFSPAGMTRTDHLTTEQVMIRDDIAHPYAVRPNGEVVDGTTTPQFTRGGATGSGYSTVSDLLRFTIALQDGTLLASEFAEQVITGKVPAPAGMTFDPPLQSNSYGYGFSDSILGGQRFIGKNGGNTIGVMNQLDIFLGLEWVALILTNSVPAVRADNPANFMNWIVPVIELERNLIAQQ